jgi:hypothetical protein
MILFSYKRALLMYDPLLPVQRGLLNLSNESAKLGVIKAECVVANPGKVLLNALAFTVS